MPENAAGAIDVDGTAVAARVESSAAGELQRSGIDIDTYIYTVGATGDAHHPVASFNQLEVASIT